MRHFLISLCVLGVLAGSAVGQQKVDDLARQFSRAFADKTLGSLDRRRPIKARITLTIEHSIMEDPPMKRTFANFAQMERWFKSQLREDGTPGRIGTKLSRCRSGSCSYDVISLLHNNLFLKRIGYGYANGKPYIRSILLIDGD